MLITELQKEINETREAIEQLEMFMKCEFEKDIIFECKQQLKNEKYKLQKLQKLLKEEDV